MSATIEGHDNVLTTAQRIVQSFSNAHDRDDMRLILSGFDNRLSTLSSFVSSSTIDPRFEAAERIILNESDSVPISKDYLDAVDDIIQFIEELNLNSNSADAIDDVVGERAGNTLQHAVARLEDEFRYILAQNTVPIDPDCLRRSSLSSSAAALSIADAEFSNSNDDVNGSFDDVSSRRYSHRSHDRGVSFGVDEMSLELIHPHAVIGLKEIADLMIRAGYEKECCQAYYSVRRDVLDECMVSLGVEKLSIEEVHRIQWITLDDKMRKWIQAVKVVVRGLLRSEKSLCEQIFSRSYLIKEVCFLEASRGCVMQLLNFGEAISIGVRSAEKLFRILDMYDALHGVFPELQALFVGEDDGEDDVGDDGEDNGDKLLKDVNGVLDWLGEAAIATFVKFENDLQGEASRKPMQNGEIHPLTRYVMNYMKLLVDYRHTLNSLLEKVEVESEYPECESNDNSEVERISPINRRTLAIFTCLESNIEEKARMYEDSAMQYIFLMNNILYIVQKVKDSELRLVLCDNWVRKRRGLVRQHATQYLRVSWSKVLACLRDEGIGGSSNNASKVILKERFKNFNACFEDIYKTQTTWKVSDDQLREELRISISEQVLPAYRSFMGRFGNHLEGRHAGRYIKYTPDEVENYLLDFFEGIPRVLNPLRRKSSN